MHKTVRLARCAAALALLVMAVPIGPVRAGDGEDPREERRISVEPMKTVDKSKSTSIGNMGLGLTNLGWFGNLLNPTVTTPSCEYPLHSRVEHMFVAGIWVGAIDGEGQARVSAGAEDTGSGSTSPKQEFGPRFEDKITILSSNPLSPNFTTRALADQHFEFSFDDFNAGGGGSPDDPHVPMGVRVHAKALAYAPQYADDFVILSFDVENIGGQELSDLHIGWYTEMTVGNTAVTVPGSDVNGWNFYDDVNGYIGPGEIDEDPDIRLMYCHDDEGENGRARSWVGVRLLGTDRPMDTFSYRQWTFGNIPNFDPDKYDYLASGRIDEGVGDDGRDFGSPGNWISMIGTGPWENFFPGDVVNFTIAIVAGLDSTQMVRNSQVAQSTYDRGFALPSGPPSPPLEVSTESGAVILRWNPGVLPPDGEYDAALASPEYHRSEFTNEYDFQGYRIYRIRGDNIEGDPFDQASLIAEFDRVTWPDGTRDDIGYNVGMPPMTPEGKREFIDRGVLNGFGYYYAVTSYSAPDPRQNLPELESGFNENALRVVPGSAPQNAEQTAMVGVYPNPYRGAGLFDQRRFAGEPSELGRKIYFTNVPARARITIFSLSGSLIDQLEHDDASTGQVAWDMVSDSTRAIAPGLYIYVVQDLSNGQEQRGKLVILK